MVGVVRQLVVFADTWDRLATPAGDDLELPLQGPYLAEHPGVGGDARKPQDENPRLSHATLPRGSNARPSDRSSIADGSS